MASPRTPEASHGNESSRRDNGARSSFDLLLPVSPERIAVALAFVVVCLTLVSLGGFALRPVLGEATRLISVGSDRSVPAWYSSLALLFCSALLATITLARKQRGERAYLRRWGVLALIFLFLATDEMLRIHEGVSDELLQPALNAIGFSSSGIFNYSWVILYIPLVAIFALAYLRFWLALPPRIRFLFLAAAVIFVGGGIVTEMLNAWYDSAFGRGGVIAILMTHFEELMEMLGVVIFAYALMSYMVSHLRIREIRLQTRRRSLR